MEIHTSHSRKDMVDLIDIYNLDENNNYLYNYLEMSKIVLSKLLWKTIQQMDSLSIKDNDLFFIKDLEHLKEYISSRSPNKSIRGKDILFLYDKLKNLNFYVKKCGYNIHQSNYNCLNDIIDDTHFVRQYGSLPAVRRIVKLINLDNQIKMSFECVMSQRQRKALELKEHIKKQTTPQFKIKKGQHIVIFE